VKPKYKLQSLDVRTVLVCLALLSASTVFADEKALNGRWALDKRNSENLASQLDELKRELRDFSYEHGKIGDPDKPDPFTSRRQLSDKEWETKRNGGVGNPSVIVQQMVDAKSLKVYVSEQIIVAYDGKIRRRISPNPNGRVHSATGAGTSTDSIGQTMAYLEADAVVIETRTNSAERLFERFELTKNDQLKLTTELHNPEWKHSVEFVRFYDRAE
jgi:hypothetical protein